MRLFFVRVVSLFLEEENDCESKKLIFEVFHFRNRFSCETHVGIGWNCGDIGRYRGYDSFLNNFETFPNFNPSSFVEIFGNFLMESFYDRNRSLGSISFLSRNGGG